MATAQAAAATAAESDQESSGRRRRRDTLTSYLNAWIGRSESAWTDACMELGLTMKFVAQLLLI